MRQYRRGRADHAAAVATFLDEVPEALGFFENETDVEFIYPDMAPDYRMDVRDARKPTRRGTRRSTRSRDCPDGLS